MAPKPPLLLRRGGWDTTGAAQRARARRGKDVLSLQENDFWEEIRALRRNRLRGRKINVPSRKGSRHRGEREVSGSDFRSVAAFSRPGLGLLGGVRSSRSSICGASL